MFAWIRRLKRPVSTEADEHATMHVVPWESLQQIEPRELQNYIGIVPYPWSCISRGNGHHDIYDHDGHRFAHVHCWGHTQHDDLAQLLKDATIAPSCSPPI